MSQQQSVTAPAAQQPAALAATTTATGVGGAAMPKAHPLQSLLSNPVVFFDVAIEDHIIGRVIIELHADVAPKTCENFRQFCIGYQDAFGRIVGYKGSKMHRVIKDFMIQGGDFISGDGLGSMSIYGKEKFDDESFALSHDRAGRLAMANSGPNTNGCQWYITCSACEWLNGKHVVFGTVLEGMLTVRKIEAVQTVGASNRPKLNVTIAQCGEL